jgi:hypothetical protein
MVAKINGCSARAYVTRRVMTLHVPVEHALRLIAAWVVSVETSRG